MALARLCLDKALACRLPALARPAYTVAPGVIGSLGGLNNRLLSSVAADDAAAVRAPSEGEENRRKVAVTDRSGSGATRRWPWRDLRQLVPFRLVNGLGSALSQALRRPLERWRPLQGKVREEEELYRLRFEVPGLGKDDVRVTVEDGGNTLVIRGEKRVDDVRGDDDGEEWWSASSYGWYHASLRLPDDAWADGVTAEVKDGVLYVTVPRAPAAGSGGRSVTEVEVQ